MRPFRCGTSPNTSPQRREYHHVTGRTRHLAAKVENPRNLRVGQREPDRLSRRYRHRRNQGTTHAPSMPGRPDSGAWENGHATRSPFRAGLSYEAQVTSGRRHAVDRPPGSAGLHPPDAPRRARGTGCLPLREDGGPKTRFHRGLHGMYFRDHRDTPDPRNHAGFCAATWVQMGGTGLEPVTPSLSIRSDRPRPVARVRPTRMVERFWLSDRTPERTGTSARCCHCCHARSCAEPRPNELRRRLREPVVGDPGVHLRGHPRVSVASEPGSIG